MCNVCVCCYSVVSWLRWRNFRMMLVFCVSSLRLCWCVLSSLSRNCCCKMLVWCCWVVFCCLIVFCFLRFGWCCLVCLCWGWVLVFCFCCWLNCWIVGFVVLMIWCCLMCWCWVLWLDFSLSGGVCFLFLFC